MEINKYSKNIIIDSEIFTLFPNFIRAVIIVENIDNSKINSYINNKLIHECKKNINTELNNNPLIIAWDDIYRTSGVNPNKFPPSIKNLVIRLKKGKTFPYINSVVSLFNYISLKYLLPCGGDDIKNIKGNLKLGFSDGSESFSPLGTSAIENPNTGEIIYFDDFTKNVMCRRFNWRNGDFTKILSTSKKIVINIDGINPTIRPTLITAMDELSHLLKTHCNAILTKHILDKKHTVIKLKY